MYHCCCCHEYRNCNNLPFVGCGFDKFALFQSILMFIRWYNSYWHHMYLQFDWNHYFQIQQELSSYMKQIVANHIKYKKDNWFFFIHFMSLRSVNIEGRNQPGEYQDVIIRSLCNYFGEVFSPKIPISSQLIAKYYDDCFILWHCNNWLIVLLYSGTMFVFVFCGITWLNHVITFFCTVWIKKKWC